VRALPIVPAAFLSAILGFVSGCALLGQDAGPAKRGLAIVGGTIYVTPTDPPIKNGVVLIQDGKISAVGSHASLRIPPDFQALDCSGKTITAGFWNSHVHFFERKWANASAIPSPELTRQLQDMFTRYGFTSVFDTGSPWDNTLRIRKRIESGDAFGPRIRSTGEVLIAPAAMPADSVLAILGDMPLRNREVTSAAEVEQASKQLLQMGVDGIKIHLQPPPPPKPAFPRDGIRAAVTLAHESNKPVFVHPNSGADVIAAVQAGVDIIAHTTPQSGPWDASLAEAMKDRSVALTPTLTLWESTMRHDRFSTQERFTAIAIGQLQFWIASGGSVLFGTDIGAIDYDPSEEYVLMSRAGLNFGQILASLTTTPAAKFGDSARLGRIAAGFEADLVVLRGDPSRDVKVLAAVAYTVQGGKPHLSIQRMKTSAPPNPSLIRDRSEFQKLNRRTIVNDHRYHHTWRGTRPGHSGRDSDMVESPTVLRYYGRRIAVPPFSSHGWCIHGGSP
jgi:imidazolonepropionase-like amidohydrolase